jgi:hypothetical protein
MLSVLPELQSRPASLFSVLQVKLRNEYQEHTVHVSNRIRIMNHVPLCDFICFDFYCVYFVYCMYSVLYFSLYVQSFLVCISVRSTATG